ncbi:MAG: sigma-70 family RNA polymerase sigma factor [Clostridia bacterium]|nr:sigma-70 family RNA polymerase sigma factor [Clostridia bacterium]
MNDKNKDRENAYLPDEQIIELYWQREEKALSATDEKYGRYLYTIAYNIVHNNQDCEECLNDTYFGTWNSIPPQRPNLFLVFLSKIMRNVAVDKYRKNTAARQVPSSLMQSLDELDESVAYSPSMEEELAINQLSELLNSWLRGLSESERFLFVCRYYYADPIAEIARMLGVSERTVFRQLTKLKNSLREHLEKGGYCCE